MLIRSVSASSKMASERGSIQVTESVLRNSSSCDERVTEATTGSGLSSRPKSFARKFLPYLSVALPILYAIPLFSLFFLLDVVSQVIFTASDDICSYNNTSNEKTVIRGTASLYIGELFIFIGFPIAGWLADTKFGRFKTVNFSLWCLWIGIVTLTLGFIFYPGVTCSFSQSNKNFFYYVGRFILLPISVILLEMSVIVFFPNVLAFIVDQMVDSPNSIVGSVVRWFAWSLFVAIFCGSLLEISYTFQPQKVMMILPVISFVWAVFCSVALIVHFFSQSIYIKTLPNQMKSPYKILYGVLKFTYKHKVPVNRSALTYWEEDAPKRIDVAKEKYGGPYTTENVEDVKTFGRVMIVIASLCVYYFSYASLSTQMLPFLNHLQYTDNLQPSKWIIYLLDPLIIMISIPILELVILPLYPKFEYILTKFFKWIGAGTFALLASTGSFLILDIVAHLTSNNDQYVCFLQWTVKDATESFSYAWVVIPALFLGISDLLVAPSIFTFICSQAPYNMRGMILGFFMLIQQVMFYFGQQVAIFFTLGKHEFPFSCGIWYWGMQVLLSVLAIVVFAIASRFYKKRERQEVDHYVRIIEDIYEKILEKNEEQRVSTLNYDVD